ncbi:ABC transporter ATP-binding protein [Microbacterium sp. NPDC087591]|uniref:ABC transporter ATP-binding protein n=1 Tax=Microbacterium sp. NPDC087591 TaxID=3364192 RepID=UPI00380392D5
MTMTDELLRVDDLVVTLPTADGPRALLGGVDLHVGRGEIVGVAGESGSGKSLTALAIMGLLPGNATRGGSIRFDGAELLDLPERRMRSLRGSRMGMVFQDPMTTLNPLFRVGDQIAEAYLIHHPRKGRAVARARALEVLRLVGVPEPERRAQQYPHQWSGGMRQRAVIAIALANDPELVIADEATTALDATIQAQVVDVLVRARDELGVSVLFISHDLGLIAQIADRAVVMYAGRVVEGAAADEIFEDSRHPYARALLASRPGSSAPGTVLPTIPGQPARPGLLLHGCPFEPRCRYVHRSERCRDETPHLLASQDGRVSACHFRDDPRMEVGS